MAGRIRATRTRTGVPTRDPAGRSGVGVQAVSAPEPDGGRGAVEAGTRDRVLLAPGGSETGAPVDAEPFAGPDGTQRNDPGPMRRC